MIYYLNGRDGLPTGGAGGGKEGVVVVDAVDFGVPKSYF